MRSRCVVSGRRFVSRSGMNCPLRLSRPPILLVGCFFVAISPPVPALRALRPARYRREAPHDLKRDSVRLLLLLLLILVVASSVAVARQRDALPLRGSRALFGFLDGNELAGPAIATSDSTMWLFGCHGYYSWEREREKLPPDLALV